MTDPSSAVPQSAAPPATDLLGETGTNRLVHTRHGFMLFNRHDTVVGRSLAYYGEYFESEVRLFRQLVRPGDVVIDAGANIGAHTLALARAAGPSGRVLAFEPVRLNHQLLCANMALNSLTQVECVQAALGETDGMLALDDVAMEAEGNFGGIALDAIPGETAVPQRRLDDVRIPGRLRLIKIDVEGMETGVLLGALGIIRRLRPALYVENDRAEKSPELIRLLQELGYSCYWYVTPFHNPDNFFRQSEPLYETGFVDDGTRLHGRGLGINLLCIPSETGGRIAGLPPVLGPEEHPLLRDCNPRFTGGR